MNTRLAKDNILGRLKQAKRTPKTAEEMAFFPWGSHPSITQEDKAERFVEMMSLTMPMFARRLAPSSHQC